jgi:hypothetical protein
VSTSTGEATNKELTIAWEKTNKGAGFGAQIAGQMDLQEAAAHEEAADGKLALGRGPKQVCVRMGSASMNVNTPLRRLKVACLQYPPHGSREAEVAAELGVGVAAAVPGLLSSALGGQQPERARECRVASLPNAVPGGGAYTISKSRHRDVAVRGMRRRAGTEEWYGRVLMLLAAKKVGGSEWQRLVLLHWFEDAPADADMPTGLRSLPGFTSPMLLGERAGAPWLQIVSLNSVLGPVALTEVGGLTHRIPWASPDFARADRLRKDV